MNIIYKRMSDESIEDYIWRICSNKDIGKYDLTWDEVGEILNVECDENYTSSKWRKNYQNEKRGYDRAIEKNIGYDDAIEELKIQQREIYKERQKFRDDKNEFNAWLREQSRMELFMERVDESAERVINSTKREIPKPTEIKISNKEIVVGLADVHYGSEFKIDGLMGDIIAEYSPEIARDRLFKLRDEIIDFSKMTGVNTINLIELGDSIEGLLHLSQLQSLKGNIVDHIWEYGELFCDMVQSLSENELFIKVYTSEGNHSDMRLLTGKKGDFPHENLEKIFARMVKKVFDKNPNVEVFSNVRGINLINVFDKTILSVHGQDESNVVSSISQYESVYNIKIDYLMVGHLHSKRIQDANGGKQVIQVPSVMGGNDYSVKIKKWSNAGSYIFTIMEGYGIRDSRDIVFK
jgi:hypothetical protein